MSCRLARGELCLKFAIRWIRMTIGRFAFGVWCFEFAIRRIRESTRRLAFGERCFELATSCWRTIKGGLAFGVRCFEFSFRRISRISWRAALRVVRLKFASRWGGGVRWSWACSICRFEVTYRWYSWIFWIFCHKSTPWSMCRAFWFKGCICREAPFGLGSGCTFRHVILGDEPSLFGLGSKCDIGSFVFCFENSILFIFFIRLWDWRKLVDVIIWRYLISYLQTTCSTLFDQRCVCRIRRIFFLWLLAKEATLWNVELASRTRVRIVHF